MIKVPSTENEVGEKASFNNILVKHLFASNLAVQNLRLLKLRDNQQLPSKHRTQELFRSWLFDISNSSEDLAPQTTIAEEKEEIDILERLIRALRDSPVTPGEISSADEEMDRLMSQDPQRVMNSLSKYMLEVFSNPETLANILLLVGRQPFKLMYGTGVTMAVAGLTHKNFMVKEAAIRAFEQWNDPSSLKILTNLGDLPEWLMSYIRDVIASIQESTSAASA